MASDTFVLRPPAPFRLDLTVWVLRRRADNRMDAWDGQNYRRALMVRGQSIGVQVHQTGAPAAPELHVTVTGDAAGPGIRPQVTQVLERLLGLHADLSGFYAFAAKDRHLAPLAERFRGFRPPRFPSLFEALVNAICCQQITLTQGIRLLNRLTGRFGQPVSGTDESLFAFPAPHALATQPLEALREQGLTRQKATALNTLSTAVDQGELEEAMVAPLADADAVRSLSALKGIGRWSAEYALLRGMGRTHIFPGDDVGARNHLQRWLDLPEPLTYRSVQSLLEPWRPYGGLLYFHLLLKGLDEAGELAI